MRENYTLKRLFIDEPLADGEMFFLPKGQVHYISNVLRMAVGDKLRFFNGREGEWLGEITSLSKKQVQINVREQLRRPVSMPDIRLAFAPIRRHRTAFVFEKATELGVAKFEPVLTARTQFPKLNIHKARAQIIEAAEQTERLDVPSVSKPMNLLDWLAQQSGRTLIFADEAGDAAPVLGRLKNLTRSATILIGPEGGFSSQERDQLKAHKDVLSVTLGPRILRADTAVLSLLTLWQASQGDWDQSPV